MMNIGKLAVSAAEHAKVVEELQDLHARHGQLISETNPVKLQRNVSIGRAPAMEECEHLSRSLQRR